MLVRNEIVEKTHNKTLNVIVVFNSKKGMTITCIPNNLGEVHSQSIRNGSEKLPLNPTDFHQLLTVG